MRYDETDMAAAYDRGRALDPSLLDRWMDVVAGHAGARPVARVLDLGCGTGRFAAALARRFDAEVVGLDPSATMLAQARGKEGAGEGRVLLVRGAAEAIPLAAASVGLVFLSMVYHHLADPAAVALLERGLPPAADVRAAFEGAGLRAAGHEVVVQAIAPDLAAYAERLAARADSILAALSPSDFEAGLAAVRADAARAGAGGGPVTEPIDVLAFRAPTGQGGEDRRG